MPALLAMLDGCHKADLARLTQCAVQVVASPLMMSLLSVLASEPREYCKAWSHEGAICIRGRSTDPGNYAYSVFWTLMCRCSEPASPVLISLQEQWPSLMDDHNSDSACSMKGDMIEALLAMWRRMPSEDLMQYGTLDNVRESHSNLADGCAAALRLILNLSPLCSPAVFANVVQVAQTAFAAQTPKSWTGNRKPEWRREVYGPIIENLIVQTIV